MDRKPISTIILLLFVLLISCLNNSIIYAQQKENGVRTIYLIRHGEYNYIGENQPDSARVLTPLGIAQARLVASRLQAMNVNFNLLLSSTMTRAIQTASVINEDFSELVAESTDLIRECTPPTWRTDVMAGVDATEGDECAANLEEAFEKYFVPSGNSENKNDIIVCHGNVIRYFVTKVLQVDTMSWLQMSISNCSLTIIRIMPNGSMKLDAFSDYGHIPENMRTFTGGKNDLKKLIIDK